jgi:hypothetical protein
MLGRAGEGPGRLESVLRVEGPGGVILHDALRVDPATWDADAYVALAPGHRVVGTVAVLGEGASGAAEASGAAGPGGEGGGRLEAGGWLWRASAVSAADVVAQLDRVR